MRFLLRTPFGPLAILVGLFAGPAAAGPFLADPGIPANSPLFVGWATGVANLTRGPQNISVIGGPLASFGTAAEALGPATGVSSAVVSLGDGGSITLTFAAPITNGPGADFAVFENGFKSGNRVFAELGFVEVSSNGTNFFRFPSISLTQTATQVGAFDSIDPTDIKNLAGKHVAGVGTPFDLAELAGVSPLLDVNRVTQVRIIDVVGSIDPKYGTLDSQGHLINDPIPTPFASGGFDLDGVGVIHELAAVPEPASAVLMAIGLASLGVLRLRRRPSIA
jgi:hypothetical protein